MTEIPIRFLGAEMVPPQSAFKKQAVAALWRIIECDNDARQQHNDITLLLSALELLPDNSTPPSSNP